MTKPEGSRHSNRHQARISAKGRARGRECERKPWLSDAGESLLKIHPNLTGDRQEILAWSWADQPPARPGGSHDTRRRRCDTATVGAANELANKNTRRQRQRTGGQSRRLPRIDSKGRPHPGWASLHAQPCVGSGGLLVSLRAHNVPGGLRLGGGLCEPPGRFPAQPLRAGLSARLKPCENRSTWNKPGCNTSIETLPSTRGDRDKNTSINPSAILSV
jgi:hypothetical protein